MKRDGKIDTVDEVINNRDQANLNRQTSTSKIFTTGETGGTQTIYSFNEDGTFTKNRVPQPDKRLFFINESDFAEINIEDKAYVSNDKLVVEKQDGTKKEYDISTSPVSGSIPLELGSDGRVKYKGGKINFNSIKTDPQSSQPLRNTGDQKTKFADAAKNYEISFRGISNFFKENQDPFAIVSGIARGAMNLVIAMERRISSDEDLINLPVMRIINALVGQTVSGTYHSGRNHRSFQDQVLEELKAVVNEDQIAKIFSNQVGRWWQRNVTMTSSNAIYISEQLKAFGKAQGFDLIVQFTNQEITLDELKQKLVDKGFDPTVNLDEVTLAKLNAAAMSVRASYKMAYDEMKRLYEQETAVTGEQKPFPEWNPNYWWSNQGFDWHEVTKDPTGFKKWLVEKLGLDEIEAEDLFLAYSYKGTTRTRTSFSLVDGRTFVPFSFSEASLRITSTEGYKKWASKNMFESLHKMQVESAKYIASTKYFGHGGRKLNEHFYDLEQDVKAGKLSEENLGKAAFITKAIIDSTHGNFRRIKNPAFAAINRFLTSWSIFAGLSLSTLSSIPETAMIYFNVKDDDEWKKANDALVNQIVALWKGELSEEYKRTELYLKKGGIPFDQNTVVDRVATGDRDMAYVKWHEIFFRTILIKQYTQFQRRMNAAFGMDFIKSGFNILLTAPRILEELPNGSQGGFANFYFDEFSEYEMKAYNQLADLGINVELVMKYFYEIDEVKRDKIFNLRDKELVPKVQGIQGEEQYLDYGWKFEPSEIDEITVELATKENLNATEREVYERAREIQDEIEEELSGGIYKFVNERIQNPQAANRPMFFQDPHYQLMTQFNGFLSAFTANIVPKLWNNQLRKGNTQVKYDTFVLVLLLLALGGASQWLKDLIKFGRPSPYLDGLGYTQRALYSSGITGQFERVIDVAKPLYPSRDDWFGSILFGELGPSIRNITSVAKGTGQLLQGKGEQGWSNVFKTMPYGGPIPSARRAGADVMTGQNPLKRLPDIPSSNEIIDTLLS